MQEINNGYKIIKLNFKDKNSLETRNKIESIQDDLEKQIKQEIGEPKGRGYCHLYWNTKKRILKEKYRIEWMTPSECNPQSRFD